MLGLAQLVDEVCNERQINLNDRKLLLKIFEDGGSPGKFIRTKHRFTEKEKSTDAAFEILRRVNASKNHS